MRISLFVIPVAALAWAAVSAAEEAPGQSRQRPGLQAADADGDGVVSRAEFAAAHAARFARLDANGDGAIDETERPARRRGHRPPRDGAAASETGADQADARPHHPMRRNPDADGDGRITRAEFDASHMAMFDRLDANHDGTLAGDELNRRHHRRPRRDAE